MRKVKSPKLTPPPPRRVSTIVWTDAMLALKSREEVKSLRANAVAAENEGLVGLIDGYLAAKRAPKRKRAAGAPAVAPP